MHKKHRFKFEKLIRNKLSERMRSQQIQIFTHPIEKEEYILQLKNKLLEETTEAIQAQEIPEILEELADVLEVIHALSSAVGFSIEKVETLRVEKKSERGGFDNSHFISHIEIASDNDRLSYFRNHPHKYPEIIESEGVKS